MRIVNLKSRRLRLAKLGNIRKGVQVPVLDKKTKKPVTDQYGKIKTYPKEVPHFVVNIDDAFADVQEQFLEVYGKKPKTIRGFLASSNLDYVWMSAYEAYVWSGMIAQADGKIVTYLFDTISKTKVITDGKLVAYPDPKAPFYNDVKDLELGDSLPYVNKMLVSNSGGGSKLELKARLNIIIQELSERAFFTVHTGGFGDVHHLQETVDDIFDIASQINLSPIMIPIVLTRYEVERKYADKDGNIKKRKGWDIQMRISPKVFEGVLEAYADSPIRLMATQPPALLPAGDDYIEPEHPSYLVEEPSEEIEDVYLVDDPQSEEIVEGQQEDPAPEQTSPIRPYSPQGVKNSVAKMVDKYIDQDGVASVDDFKILASVLNTTLGSKTKRYELCQWLVGEASTKKMVAAQIKALLVWQGVTRFEEMPSDEVLAETHACHIQALKDAGQQELEI